MNSNTTIALHQGNAANHNNLRPTTRRAMPVPSPIPNVAVDVLMATAHTVVVSARVHLMDGAGELDIELVVRRQDCKGLKPSLPALQDAASHAMQRLQCSPACGGAELSHLAICVDGRWHNLVDNRRPSAARTSREPGLGEQRLLS